LLLICKTSALRPSGDGFEILLSKSNYATASPRGARSGFGDRS
jgi:hypothetical protein